MTKGLQSYMFEPDLCKLKVYSLESMTNGLQSKLRFAHAADILFVHFKFMLLTYGMNVRHDLSKQDMYALFSRKGGLTCAW